MCFCWFSTKKRKQQNYVTVVNYTDNIPVVGDHVGSLVGFEVGDVVGRGVGEAEGENVGIVVVEKLGP